MKTFLLFITIAFLSVPSAFSGQILADCSDAKVIAVGSAVYLDFGGRSELVERNMEDGYVSYSSPSVKFEIHGNIRSAGRLTAYLSETGRRKVTLLCDSGSDVEKIADDTDLF